MEKVSLILKNSWEEESIKKGGGETYLIDVAFVSVEAF